MSRATLGAGSALGADPVPEAPLAGDPAHAPPPPGEGEAEGELQAMQLLPAAAPSSSSAPEPPPAEKRPRTGRSSSTPSAGLLAGANWEGAGAAVGTGPLRAVPALPPPSAFGAHGTALQAPLQQQATMLLHASGGVPGGGGGDFAASSSGLAPLGSAPGLPSGHDLVQMLLLGAADKGSALLRAIGGMPGGGGFAPLPGPHPYQFGSSQLGSAPGTLLGVGAVPLYTDDQVRQRRQERPALVQAGQAEQARQALLLQAAAMQWPSGSSMPGLLGSAPGLLPGVGWSHPAPPVADGGDMPGASDDGDAAGHLDSAGSGAAGASSSLRALQHGGAGARARARAREVQGY
jgi:hypothetical protein